MCPEDVLRHIHWLTCKCQNKVCKLANSRGTGGSTNSIMRHLDAYLYVILACTCAYLNQILHVIMNVLSRWHKYAVGQIFHCWAIQTRFCCSKVVKFAAIMHDVNSFFSPLLRVATLAPLKRATIKLLMSPFDFGSSTPNGMLLSQHKSRIFSFVMLQYIRLSAIPNIPRAHFRAVVFPVPVGQLILH